MGHLYSSYRRRSLEVQLYKLFSSSSHQPDLLFFFSPGVVAFGLRKIPKLGVAQQRREVRIKLRGKSMGKGKAGLTRAAEIKADSPDGDADSNCLSSIIHQTAVL